MSIAKNNHGIKVTQRSLRRLRKLAGLTQRELARAAGLNPSSLGQVETGYKRMTQEEKEKLGVILERILKERAEQARAVLA